MLRVKNKKISEAASSEQPKQPAYDRELFYRIHIPDLLADLVLIFFSFFISNELFSKTGFVPFSSWQIAAMYCIVTLTLPWYLGYIYTCNSVFYGKRTMKIFLWIFIMMTLMILVNLIRLVLLSDILEGGGWGGINEFTGVFAVFLLVLGPMMSFGGAASAHQEFSEKGNPDKKFTPDKMAASAALLVIVLAIAFMIYFSGLFPQDSNVGAIVAFLGGPVAAVIVFGLFIGLLALLDKIGIYKYLAILAQNTFPFFIISVLVFWSGIALHFMQNDFANEGGKVSSGAMLFSLTISGLIPFRLLMIFNAPLRIGNIIIGIVSLAYFCFQMVMLG